MLAAKALQQRGYKDKGSPISPAAAAASEYSEAPVA